MDGNTLVPSKESCIRSVLSHWEAKFPEVLGELYTTRDRFLEALSELGFDQEVVQGASRMLEEWFQMDKNRMI